MVLIAVDVLCWISGMIGLLLMFVAEVGGGGG